MITYRTSNLILSAMCGKTSSCTLANRAYLALSSTQPSAAGTGVTEPSGKGYERKEIGNASYPYGQLMGTPTNGEITNNQEIHFNEATAAWGELSHACIYDAQTGGNLVAWGELGTYSDGVWTPSTISPLANTVVVIKTGDLKISIT